jgi:hypothetical protein
LQRTLTSTLKKEEAICSSQWHTSETLGGQKERDIVVDLDVDARGILKWTLKDGVGDGAVESVGSEQLL